MAAGSLIKATYLPIALMQMIILLFYPKKLYASIKTIFHKALNHKEIILISLFLVLLFLSLKLYLVNLITYHQLMPSSDKVLGYEVAYNNFRNFKTYADLKATAHQREVISFPRYTFHYIMRSFKNIFGIMGHKHLFRETNGVLFYLLPISISLATISLKLKNALGLRKNRILLFTVMTYPIIVFLNNYQLYKVYNYFGAALQGRYNFPVLVLAITFLLYNFLRHFDDKIKMLILLGISPLLVYNNWFWFLTMAPTNWYIGN
jgi:hypothetical protein